MTVSVVCFADYLDNVILMDLDMIGGIPPWHILYIDLIIKQRRIFITLY